jgi:hypothetical protein
MKELGFHWTDFHEIMICIFQKSVEKIQVSLKFVKNNCFFYTKTYVHL